MRFPITMLMLAVLLLQAVGVGVAEASAKDPAELGCAVPSLPVSDLFEPVGNRCCSVRKLENNRSGMDLAHSADGEPMAGKSIRQTVILTATGALSVSSEGEASSLPQWIQPNGCCSGCHCNVQDPQAPPTSPDSPAAPSLPRFSPPESIDVVSAVLPLPATSAQAYLAARSRLALLNPPVKRAPLSVLHCAFLI